ncbi:AcvB/VirJ family lysyl-phosphatidylglycerol hydrolase [Compostibacter hankyongensis]
MRKRILYVTAAIWLFLICRNKVAGENLPAEQPDSLPGERLPVQEVTAREDSGMPMLLLLTGDGGWKGFDVRLSGQFAARSVPVAALNSLKYFWKKRTPEETAAAVKLLLDRYTRLWHKQDFILAGFSFGADVLPFVVNRLPSALLAHCRGVVLFSPGTSTDFEIHLSQMMGKRKEWKYSVVNELNRMTFRPLLCLFGEAENDYPMASLSDRHIPVFRLPGGHEYTDDHRDVAGLVLAHLR